MIRLKDTRHSNTSEFLTSAIRIAEYYGFSPLDDMKPMKIAEGGTETRTRQKNAKPEEIAFARRDERALASSARKCVSCARGRRSEEHTSELQSQSISYAVFCLKKKKQPSRRSRAPSYFSQNLYSLA